MEKMEVAVLSKGVNCPVMQFPGRRLPGVLIQGDSLSILLGSAKKILEAASKQQRDEVIGEAEYLVDLLQGYIQAYETALKEHDLKLPYSR